MCDPFVEELLKRWGVSQLADRCREQELDLDGLRSLEEEVIAELVPLIGPRCKFRKAWRTWLDAGAAAPSPGPPEPALHAGQAPEAPAAPSKPRALAPIPEPLVRRGGRADCITAPLSLAQPGSADVGGKKEVNVFLEGKIVYDGDASGGGWLVADGTLGTLSQPETTWSPTLVIKAEPSEDLPQEMQAAASQLIASCADRKQPRFHLEGRITLSLQDFAEVPAFMVSATMDDGPAQSHAQDPDPPPPPQQQPSYQPSQHLAEAAEACPSGRPSLAAAQEGCATSGTRPGTSRPASGKRSRREKLDLEALLNASSKGKMIMSLYQQRGCLDGPARQTLTDLIIAEELREDFNLKITSQRFQEIAETIVELFPGENVDTYYCNDRLNWERPGGKGKLSSKYYNTRRQLAKTGVICRGANKERRQTYHQGTYAALQRTPAEEEIAQQSIKWLQSLGWHSKLSSQDMDTAFDKWQKSWKLRFLQILTQGHQPMVYLETYPILKMSVGEKLIRSDFDILFKNAGTRLTGYWPSFCQSIISMLSEDYRKSVPLLDHVKRSVITAEGKQVGALLLLPSMLPVTTCRGSTDSSELWRPTRQEAQDGFLLYVKEDGEVSGALERHWCRMRSLGLPVSPLPVVVGHSLDAVHSALVAIDQGTAFYVANATQAVDLCFKCFHALQVPYPPQAQNVWLFLQHAVYQVATPADRVSVAVNSLLADFGLRPVPSVASWDRVLSGQRPAAQRPGQPGQPIVIS